MHSPDHMYLLLKSMESRFGGVVRVAEPSPDGEQECQAASDDHEDLPREHRALAPQHTVGDEAGYNRSSLAGDPENWLKEGLFLTVEEHTHCDLHSRDDDGFERTQKQTNYDETTVGDGHAVEKQDDSPSEDKDSDRSTERKALQKVVSGPLGSEISYGQLDTAHYLYYEAKMGAYQRKRKCSSYYIDVWRYQSL